MDEHEPTSPSKPPTQDLTRPLVVHARNGNSLTEQNPVTICGTYASGWEARMAEVF